MWTDDIEDEDFDRKNSHQLTGNSDQWKTLAENTEGWQTLADNTEQGWNSPVRNQDSISAEDLDDPSQEIEIRIDVADDDDVRDPLTEDLYCDDEFQETNLVNP